MYDVVPLLVGLRAPSQLLYLQCLSVFNGFALQNGYEPRTVADVDYAALAGMEVGLRSGNTVQLVGRDRVPATRQANAGYLGFIRLGLRSRGAKARRQPVVRAPARAVGCPAFGYGHFGRSQFSGACIGSRALGSGRAATRLERTSRGLVVARRGDAGTCPPPPLWITPPVHTCEGCT